jgi:imidazolonepropionase-like amidohydrolase
VAKDPATAKHKRALAIAMENVKKLQEATVPLAFGTDSGANPYRVPGFAEHRELQLLVEAGLSPLEAIHSATQSTAVMLHIDEKTGTIQPGKQADLLVLNGDPSKDIANTEKIEMVFHNGRQVKREPAEKD